MQVGVQRGNNRRRRQHGNPQTRAGQPEQEEGDQARRDVRSLYSWRFISILGALSALSIRDRVRAYTMLREESPRNGNQEALKMKNKPFRDRLSFALNGLQEACGVSETLMVLAVLVRRKRNDMMARVEVVSLNVP
jgi:hypothetical protein